MKLLRSMLWVGFSLALSAGTAAAQPPDGAPTNGPVHDWFAALVRSDGIHCCAESDCRPAASGELIPDGDGMSIHINGSVEPVPESLIVRRESNPLGASI